MRGSFFREKAMVYYTLIDVDSSAKEQHNAAHKLLDEALMRICGIKKYSLVRGEHGKPFIEKHSGIFFNLSHCIGMAACVVSDAENGIDAELIRPYSGSAANRVFTENEMRFVSESENSDENFFRLWTLKEAVGKAIGTGIFSNLKEYEFDFRGGKPLCKSMPKKVFTQKIIRGKWVVSVCSECPEKDFTEIIF